MIEDTAWDKGSRATAEASHEARKDIGWLPALGLIACAIPALAGAIILIVALVFLFPLLGWILYAFREVPDPVAQV